jgi:hypothetical protein
MPSAHAMGHEVSVPQNLKNRWGCAGREQSSDAERDCLAQRKRKAGLKPGATQEKRWMGTTSGVVSGERLHKDWWK